MAAEVEITVASHPRWLRLVRRVVAEYADLTGLDAQSTRELMLAVDEASANVIKHSYQGDSGQRLTVTARSVEDGVEVEIQDNGAPFNPIDQPIPPPDELRVGGRGMFLMQSVMDEVDYERRDGKNCVRMRKRVKPHAE
jgi:serine/threonine-protein kinase RsbW